MKRERRSNCYPEQAVRGRSVRIHRIRAEHALGRPLPNGCEVHHADLTRSIDSPLVICQDHAYHFLLHRRTRVVRAGGNPDLDSFCTVCKKALPLSAFYYRKTAVGNAKVGDITTHCRECSARGCRKRTTMKEFPSAAYDQWKTTEPDSDDPGRLRTDEDYEPPPVGAVCDFCGGDVRYPVTLAGVGLTCSTICMNRLEAQYAEALQGRRD